MRVETNTILAGGLLGDNFGIRAPFDVACGFFLLSCVYLLVSLPYIPPPVSTGKSSKRSSGFLAPLRLLAPQNLRLASGKMSKHYGVLFLCAGIFLGVVRFCNSSRIHSHFIRP